MTNQTYIMTIFNYF